MRLRPFPEPAASRAPCARGAARPPALLVLALLAAVGVLAPRAGPPASAREPVRSLLELRRQGVVVQQWDLSCGAAALATLLVFQHGDVVDEREITRGLINRKDYIENPELVRLRQGFSLLDLKRYVDGRGYTGIGYGRLDLARLLPLAPAIVPIRTQGYNHFVIFRGVGRGRVLVADPAFGNWTLTVPAFEAAWLDFGEIGRVAFVVAGADGKRAPPGGLAPQPGQFLAPPAAAVRQSLFRRERYRPRERHRAQCSGVEAG